MKVIEVKNLVKKYQPIEAVSDISFTIDEGTIFGLLGPNGAGKTTTIECILGMKNRDAGDITVLGLEPTKDSQTLYNLIGVQLQETSYQDKIKVNELCDLFTSMYENPIDYQNLLQRFGLSNKKKSYVNELSGGQRQKIAIILALIANPKIIFLDELTTGLDPKSRREMWEYVKELRAEGRTIFMTTHYMEEAAYLCDKIGIIDEGKIIALDTVEKVIENANIDTLITFEIDEDITIQLKEQIKGIDQITYDNKKIQLYTDNEEILTDIIIFMKDNNFKYKKLTIVRPGLEDAFLKLTGKEWRD